MSFPKAYWQSRSVQVGALCEHFSVGQTRSPLGPTGKESSREVLISDETLGNLIGLLDDVCRYCYDLIVKP